MILGAVEEPHCYSADWFRSVLDSVSEFVLVKGPRSQLLWANRAFRDYYGLTTEALRDLIDSSHADPADTLQYVRDDQEVFRGGRPLEIVEPITRHDGDVGYFNTVKTPFREASSGILLGTVGTSRPVVSQLENAERLLLRHDRQHELARLRGLVESLPISALLLDAQQRIVAATLLFETEFGVEVLEGAEFSVLVGDSRVLGLAIERAINQEESTDGIDLQTQEPRRIWEASVRPWYLPDDRIGGAFVACKT